MYPHRRQRNAQALVQMAGCRLFLCDAAFRKQLLYSTYIGEQKTEAVAIDSLVCLRSPLAGQQRYNCARYYQHTAVEDWSCGTLASAYRISTATLQQLNPSLDCSRAVPRRHLLCVAGTSITLLLSLSCLVQIGSLGDFLKIGHRPDIHCQGSYQTFVVSLTPVFVTLCHGPVILWI